MSAELIDFLMREKVLTADHLARVRSEDRAQSSTTIRQLVAGGLINEAKLVNYLGNAFHLPVTRITTVDASALDLMSTEHIKKLQCLPFRFENNTVHVAMADPTRLDELERVKSIVNYPVVFVLTTFSNLEAAVSQVLKLAAPPTRDPAHQSGGPSPQGHGSVRPKLSNSVLGSPKKKDVPLNSYQVRKFNPQDSVPAIFNAILSEAVSKDASDIHIEPHAGYIGVRLRIEGLLHELFHVPMELKDQLSSRIKVMANLDISERRLPQDGRITFQSGKVNSHFRLSIIPANNGESIVLRVLKPEGAHLELSSLGFTESQLISFRKGINATNGMVLVTGPTGCGKTTTLYSALNEINLTTEKIATVEDPIEYNLDGIIQVQVNNETGLSFATILKSLLRQDPDVLLVGEIRDQETAAIAVQAALSGHLVLSTLHTNDAPSAILRLLNMGMEPYMVLASVTTLAAQRLVRKICTDCKQEVGLGGQQLSHLGHDAEIVKDVRFFKGKGCGSCLGVGYKGRAAIFEVLELTDPLKELLLKGENPVSFKRKAVESGMKTLRQSALQLVASGVTTLEEALATTAEK